LAAPWRNWRNASLPAVWQKRLQALEEALGFFRLAFPDRDHAPSESAQGCGVAFVAGGVAFEFFAPPRAAGFWNARVFAIAMEMPEAPVHENAGPVAW
jgi:hypothetical protein